MTAKKTTKRPTIKERRTERRSEIQTVLDALVSDRDEIVILIDRIDMLDSVSAGLYEELEKLSKKAPVDEATDLVVEHVNEVVQDVRDIAKDDPYVQKINTFVPAGDNPEHRDVVLVLKQVRQGLQRIKPVFARRKVVSDSKISIARGLIVALDLYIADSATQISSEDLEENGVHLSAEWFTGPPYSRSVALDRVDAFDPETLRPASK